jgi:hypothetical protein
LSTDGAERQALYYPFHLCHEETLKRLLERYKAVHFMDFMALQLTMTCGTTAYADRMGNFHPDLVTEGRIVQGHAVSGPLDRQLVSGIDRNLSDRVWRSLFHEAFRSDRRFQRGVLDVTHGMRIGGKMVPGAAAVLELVRDERQQRPYSVEAIRKLSHASSTVEGYDFEYGLALLKTAASLLHTVRLCHKHRLEAVTDSERHYALLQHMCNRDHIVLKNACVRREGY